jgi:hypothetical protein
MAAERHFDCGSISATAAPEHRWPSFPGGRLCFNPASKGDFVTLPLPLIWRWTWAATLGRICAADKSDVCGFGGCH